MSWCICIILQVYRIVVMKVKLMLNEYIPCFKWFTIHTDFNSNNHVRQLILSFSFYGWKDWGTQKLSGFPKVTQQISGNTKLYGHISQLWYYSISLLWILVYSDKFLCAAPAWTYLPSSGLLYAFDNSACLLWCLMSSSYLVFQNWTYFLPKTCCTNGLPIFN